MTCKLVGSYYDTIVERSCDREPLPNIQGLLVTTASGGCLVPIICTRSQLRMRVVHLLNYWSKYLVLDLSSSGQTVYNSSGVPKLSLRSV